MSFEVFVAIMVFLIGTIIWAAWKHHAFMKTFVPGGFDEDRAIDFTLEYISGKFPGVTKEEVAFVLEKEWEWQYDKAPRQDGSIQLVERTNPEILSDILKAAKGRFPQLTKKHIETILKGLEEYENTIYEV